jgi:hypothetical protein
MRRTAGLGNPPKGKRRKSSCALVAGGIDGAMQFGTGPCTGADHAARVMPGGQAIGAEIAGHRQQIGKLWPHVAADAGNRGATGEIFIGETLHHAGPERSFMVEHVVGDAQPVGNGPRVADILPGAAGALALHRGAMVVQLQGDPDHLGPALRGQRRNHRTVDSPRHGDDGPTRGQRRRELEQRCHLF